jgi:hypothetical protein
MLDPKFKSFQIIASFVGLEQVVNFVEEYDMKFLYPMLVKCHEHLYPLVSSDRNNVDQGVFDYDYNLNIFEQTTNTTEPM